jgi:hypothetical protein
MTGREWMSPLTRAERFLAVRLLELERQMSDAKGNPELWRDYVDTVAAFTQVRAQLYRVPMAAAPAAARPARRGAR